MTEGSSSDYKKGIGTIYCITPKLKPQLDLEVQMYITKESGLCASHMHNSWEANFHQVFPILYEVTQRLSSFICSMNIHSVQALLLGAKGSNRQILQGIVLVSLYSSGQLFPETNKNMQTK